MSTSEHDAELDENTEGVEVVPRGALRVAYDVQPAPELHPARHALPFRHALLARRSEAVERAAIRQVDVMAGREPPADAGGAEPALRVSVRERRPVQAGVGRLQAATTSKFW